MYRYHLAASLAMLIGAAPVCAAQDVPPRQISVTGHGEARAAPDMAMVTIGNVEQAETAAAALSASNESMSAIVGVLKQAGIAEHDMQTSSFMIQPRYDYGDSTKAPRLIGYEVTNTLSVAVRRLDRLGALLDRAVTSGSNRIDGIGFQIADPAGVMDEARRRAAADARRKADLYAVALGVNLGRVLAVSEAGILSPPIPMQMKTMAEASAEVPIARGEQLIAIDVTIAWEIR